MSGFLGAEAQLAEAQRIAKLGSWEWDRVADEVTCSREMLRLLGLPLDETTVSGEAVRARLHPRDLARVRQTFAQAERTRGGCTVDHAIVTPDGTTRYVQTRVQPYACMGGRVLVGTMQDVSERRDLEQQLRHAQKMEALGRLAGGIAHDFNNLLAGITVNADLLLDGDFLSGDQYEEAMEIRRTTERAAALTRQLHAFSRRQAFRPEVLDVNLVVRELERMLRRLLNARVELTCVLDPRACHVEADRGQLEQAIMNLVVNARDAMPSGGTIVIETRMRAGCAGCDAASETVTIVVRDTGHGMDAAVQERLFEPFFTTKSAEQGSGLGLATVYGIVQQARGTITVESEPGQGAEFRVTLPRSHRGPAAAAPIERRTSAHL